MPETFERALQDMHDQHLLGVSSDQRYGVLFQLGLPIERKKPLKNQYLSPLMRTHKGSHAIFIEAADWYMRSPDGSKIEAEGMWSDVSDLVGTTIRDIKTTSDRLIVEIGWSDGSHITIDSRQLEDTSDCGYSISVGPTTWSVDGNGDVDIEVDGATSTI